MNPDSDTNRRHVLGISGGKDSAALAIYMRDRVPQMEYYFCDTHMELPETYEFLARLEAYLGKPIARLNADRGFDHWLKAHDGYLPSPQARWCTYHMKIRPFEEWVAGDEVYSYVGLRADEEHRGEKYVPKGNITNRYPFKEDGLIKEDVIRVLEEAGLGIPSYYEWRSRSGCYFCFFQRKIEWVGLKERYPELFERAKSYERAATDGMKRYTWSADESLDELAKPDRVAQIKERHQVAMEREIARGANKPLYEVLEDVLDDEDDDFGCMVCHL